MDYDQKLARQLRNGCPTGAMHVVFVGDVEGGNSRRYPNEGYFDFWENDSIPLPNGKYLLTFYDQFQKLLRTPTQQYLVISRPGTQYAQQVASGGHITYASEQPVSQSERHPVLPEHARELSEIEVNLRATTAEFQKHKMALSMQQDAQRLARSTRYTRELQEAANLNVTYRLEMQAMAETHSNLTRRHVEHSAKLIEALGSATEAVGTIMANMQKAAATIGQPAPAPVDYGPTILKALGMAGGLAMNLIATARNGTPAKAPIFDHEDLGEEDDEEDEDAVDAELIDKTDKATRSRPADFSNGSRPAKPRPPKQEPPAPVSKPTQPGTKAQSRARSEIRQERVSAQAPQPSTPAAVAPLENLNQPNSGPHHSEEAERESKLQSLVEEFAQGAEAAETALPLGDETPEQAGIDYFLAPDHAQEMDELTRLLSKLPSRGQLEQMIALTAPHLQKKTQ